MNRVARRDSDEVLAGRVRVRRVLEDANSGSVVGSRAVDSSDDSSIGCLRACGRGDDDAGAAEDERVDRHDLLNVSREEQQERGEYALD